MKDYIKLTQEYLESLGIKNKIYIRKKYYEEQYISVYYHAFESSDINKFPYIFGYINEYSRNEFEILINDIVYDLGHFSGYSAENYYNYILKLGKHYE